MNSIRHSVIPTFGKIVARDLLKGPRTTRAPEEHLQAALDWLTRAHDATEDGGVSYGYSLRGGWKPSYIETSGYIATTFYNLAAGSKHGDGYAERAEQIVQWLCEVQNADGSFSNPRFSSGGIVFDTGQDLFGLVRGYRETKDKRILASAERAADWLVNVADSEGRWTKSVHNGIPHVYNSRVAWALLQLHAESPTEDRERVARANLDWAVSQQKTNGWYEECAFERGKAPFTHTIAYAIRGLLEAGLIANDDSYIDSALRAAQSCISAMDSKGYIAGQIDTQGQPAASYSCLTGTAQLAIVWAKLFERTGEPVYKDAAVRGLRYVMSCQDLKTHNVNVRGAIKGSHPTWGRYSPVTFPNWATKFFIDAMLLAEDWF